MNTFRMFASLVVSLAGITLVSAQPLSPEQIQEYQERVSHADEGALRAQWQLQHGDLEGAIENLRTALIDLPDWELTIPRRKSYAQQLLRAATELARQHLENGNAEEAEALLQRALPLWLEHNAEGALEDLDQIERAKQGSNSGNDSPLMTQTFRVPPDFQDATQEAQAILTKAGIRFPKGTNATYESETSLLTVTNTEANLELVETFVDSLINPK